MKTLARSNISENPVTSIIARLLVMQVNNAAISYRLFETREKGKLQQFKADASRKEYSQIRYSIAECETFGRFARLLAKEWNSWRKY